MGIQAWRKHRIVVWTALLVLVLLAVSNLLQNNKAGAEQSDPAAAPTEMKLANLVAHTDASGQLLWDAAGAIPPGHSIVAAMIALPGNVEPQLVRANASEEASEPSLGVVQHEGDSRTVIHLNALGLALLQIGIDQPAKAERLLLRTEQPETATGEPAFTILYQ